MNSRTTPWMFVLVVVLVSLTSWTEASRSDILDKLSQLVENEQMTETRPFDGFGHFAQLEGAYYSDIRLNFRGKCDQNAMRKHVQAPTLHSFLSLYVGVMIFDALRYGKAPQPSQTSIERTTEMVGAFNYKNLPFNNSIIAFFQQVYDEEHDNWIQKPKDVLAIFKSLGGLNPSPDMMARAILGDNLPPDLVGILAPENIVRLVEIPPDFDCTGVHLSFGSLLYLFRDKFPTSWDVWNNNNSNVTSVFDEAKRYAYRPFSDDPDANTIDPRTYYVMRNFLDQAKKEGRDLVILNTWAQSISEGQVEYKKGVPLPWGVNIVDVAVTANYFAGVISSVTFGLVDPKIINDDADFNVLLESSSDHVVHLVKNNFEDRIDIAAPYYPSMTEIYWFIARGLMLMENARINGPLPVPALERYYHKLAAVMRDEATSRILALGTVGDNGDIYYDDFLGNGDLSYYDRPIKRHEDRIFTTSMAANSLITTWTVHDEVNGLRWIEGTPGIVKDTVHGCARWLEANTLTGEYNPDSIFFRFDLSFDSLPFFYPANRFEYFNGTQIEDFTYIPAGNTTIGIQGYVEPDDYEEMLKVVQFGVPRRDEFEGFNNMTGNLIFFDGDAFTYASVMMALSMEKQLGGT